MTSPLRDFLPLRRLAINDDLSAETMHQPLLIGHRSIARLATRPDLIVCSLMEETAMALELTAVFREAPEGGYVAFLEELPGANTQGETLAEARVNLREAVALVLEANRALSEEDLIGQTVIRERLNA
jgi:predicted RNase H-like HicB family nuclease